MVQVYQSGHGHSSATLQVGSSGMLYGIYWKPCLQVLSVVPMDVYVFVLLYGSMAGNDTWNVFASTC